VLYFSKAKQELIVAAILLSTLTGCSQQAETGTTTDSGTNGKYQSETFSAPAHIPRLFNSLSSGAVRIPPFVTSWPTPGATSEPAPLTAPSKDTFVSWTALSGPVRDKVFLTTGNVPRAAEAIFIDAVDAVGHPLEGSYRGVACTAGQQISAAESCSFRIEDRELAVTLVTSSSYVVVSAIWNFWIRGEPTSDYPVPLDAAASWNFARR
jgi:hypothetical protein